MTGRERLDGALSSRGSPQIPVTLCYESILTRDHWDELTSHPWFDAFHPHLDVQLSWREEVIRALGQDWYRVPLCRTREERDRLTVEERPEGVFLIDAATGDLTPLERPRVGGWSESTGVVSVHPIDVARDVADVDAAITIPADDVIERNAQAGVHDLAAQLAVGPGRRLFALQHVGSPLWHCYGLWGFEGMMRLVAEDPALVERACERHLSRSLTNVREAAVMGAQGVWIEECMTDMISPQAYGRLCLPAVRAIVDEIRKSGMKSIHYFCGDPAGKLQLLLQTGADALALEESKKGFTIEISDVAAEIGGSMSLLGNLDSIAVLQNGSDEELETEVRRQLDAGRDLLGGDAGARRFVAALGSPVTPATPVARVRQFCDLVRESALA